jgi:hypothetical protein
MMWDRVFVVQNDLLPFVRKTLRDATGPIDLLTGVSGVTFSMREVNSTTAKVTNQACVVIQSSPTVDKGVVEYRWTGTTPTDTAGIYVAEFSVQYVSGGPATFPGPMQSSLIVFIRPQIA